MRLSRAIATAVIFGAAIMPAAAADLSSGYYVKHRRAKAPFYLVDQGPVLSGPGISIVWIGRTKTGVRRAYPYVSYTRAYPYIGSSHYDPTVLRARY